MFASAAAHPNIAFIKYWGNRDALLRLPLTGSISMALDGLETRTSVCFDVNFQADSFTLNGEEQQDESLARVSGFLDHVRELAGSAAFARVESENNFPTAAGIASSASAFAALALAGSAAIGLSLSEQELSRLARLGSGSACRSIPGGFVAWLPGNEDADSYAVSIAPPEHWQLFDLVTILDRGHKSTGSASGMALAHTSPLLGQRLAELPTRLTACKQALLARDFEAFAELVEADSQSMHIVMQTSTPALQYTLPLTELILGKPLVEAERVTNQDIAAFLGELPEEKMHCSVMGKEALESALANYRGAGPAPKEEGEIVCRCFGVTDAKIARVVRENKLTTPEQVTHYCKAGGAHGPEAHEHPEDPDHPGDDREGDQARPQGGRRRHRADRRRRRPGPGRLPRRLRRLPLLGGYDHLRGGEEAQGVRLPSAPRRGGQR